MIDKQVFRNISYGMYLVTTNNKKKNGCIINTLTQITSENPIISISINKNNFTNNEIKESKKFAVSILSIDTDSEVISNFGYKTGNEVDKFESVEYEEISNLPVITKNMVSYLICEVINVIDCETHDIFLGRVIKTKNINNIEPMTYKYYHEVRKGTSPKNAPTFIEEKKEDAYRCPICGYIHDNAKEEIKFEDLSEDWVCPLCKAPKKVFEKI